MTRQGFPGAIWHASPNFGHGSQPWNWGRIGRADGSPIRWIVPHTLEYFDTSRGLHSLSRYDRSGLKSAHYLVADDAIYQLVDDRNQAWTQGINPSRSSAARADYDNAGGSPNPWSIGIETVGVASDPATWTQGTIDNWGALVGWLSWAYGIPLEYTETVVNGRADNLPLMGVVAHGAISSYRSDPGTHFPWGEIRQAAVTYLDQTPHSVLASGLDTQPQVQAQLQGHPHYQGPETEPPPLEVSEEPQVMMAGIGGGPVLALLMVATGLAWWANR